MGQLTYIQSFRRRFLAISLASVALCLQSAFAADAYPSKPIRFVVGFSAGGSTDVIARMLAKNMGEILGQAVIVDNRAGAGGALALQYVSQAAADGYTILMVTASATTLPFVRKVPFDLERDFSPISLIGIGPQVLMVNAQIPAKSVSELAALARENPSKYTYGTSGPGTPSHLAGLLFDKAAGVKTVHIPYKGSSQNIVAVQAGEVSMSYSDAVSSMTALQTGKVRALAVTTKERASFMPTVPTFEEAGLHGLVVPLFFGVAVPAGTPQDIVTRLNEAIGKALAATGTKEALNQLGVDPKLSTPDEFKAFLREELAKNQKLIQSAGLKIQE